MGLSRTVSKINSNFGQILLIFPPHVINAPLREFVVEFCNCGSVEYMELCPYQMVETC